MPKHIVVIELEASQTEVDRLVGRIDAIAEELGTPMRVESFILEGPSTAPSAAFLRALNNLDQMVAADRAEHARKIQPGDLIIYWDDEKGFAEGRVTRIQDEAGLVSFWVEGREECLPEEDIYRPLSVHDAYLWSVQPGDDLEWYCPPSDERSAGAVIPHCPDAEVSACPGGLWHRAHVGRVFHEGFEAPCFQVEGCSQRLGEPAFQIRVPVPLEQPVTRESDRA